MIASPPCMNVSLGCPRVGQAHCCLQHCKTVSVRASCLLRIWHAQVAKLEQWHPSQHVFTESLAGSIESESIVCEGATNKQTGDTFPGKHVGTVELAFNGEQHRCRGVQPLGINLLVPAKFAWLEKLNQSVQKL